MKRSQEEKDAVVHRSMDDGDLLCVCNHLKREHLGGKEDCDKCSCDSFLARLPIEQ